MVFAFAGFEPALDRVDFLVALFIVAFLGRGRSHGAQEAREVPGIMLYPLFALATMSIIAGFTPIAEKLSPAFHHPHAFDPTNPVFLLSLAALAIGIAGGVLTIILAILFLLFR